MPDKDYTKDLETLGTQTQYPLMPDIAILESFPNPSPGSDYSISFDCPEFTSMCPVTGQPDYGRFIIEFVPDQLCLESKSLKLYLFSFRNEAAFWEDLSNRIADDIFTLLRPHSLKLTGYMNPRGAISITTVVRRGGART
jgi:7-cyano-7-deazaguanine reductase